MKLSREERKRLRYNETHEIIDGLDHKFCKSCNSWLPSENCFYKKKVNTTDGLDTYCKECTKDKTTKWKNENKELVRGHHNKYNSTVKRKLVNKKFNDKDKTKDKYSQWRRDNADKVKEYRIKRSKHKKHNITKKEWIACKNYFNDECAYCGLHVNEHYRLWNGEFKKVDLHKEHVDHEGSDRLDNCIPSCQSCNSSKREYRLEEWYKEDNIVTNFSKERLDKIHKWLKDDYKIYMKFD